MKCQITENGYLQMPAEIAETYFQTNAIIVVPQEEHLLVMPVSYVGAGGLILKYRNKKGDRSVFITEFLPEDVDYGERTVEWDEEALALRVPLYL
ncbi:MAG: hydrogenase maturation protease [Bacilli bacterium]|nr:hydrogenase maturation protease [Bacilli bacterium]